MMEVQPSDLPWKPDVILASPPCQMFSTGGWHQHSWAFNRYECNRYRRYRALDSKTLIARRLVLKTVRLIEDLQPKLFVIENPKALLRKLDRISHHRKAVGNCH